MCLQEYNKILKAFRKKWNQNPSCKAQHTHRQYVADPWHFGVDPDPDLDPFVDPCLLLMDPDPDPAIFVIDLQSANKKVI